MTNELKSASPAIEDDPNLDDETQAIKDGVDRDRKESAWNEMDDIKIVHQDDENAEQTASKQDGAEIDGSIPIQVYTLCMTQIFCTMGFTVYSSMFALYVIELYGLNSLHVGYITLVLASFVVASNVLFVSLNKRVGIYRLVTIVVSLNKRVGIYRMVTIGCSLFCVALSVAPFIDNLWGMLIVIMVGMGLGYGQMAPGITSAAAALTNVKNRGSVLSLVSASQSVSLIIGPLLMGYLYGLSPRYPFHAGGVAVFLGIGLLIAMMCKWPELTAPSQAVTSVGVDDEDWVYVADKVHRKDYMRLGKALGTMLSERHYKWVSNFPLLIEYLDLLFPVIGTDREGRGERTRFLMQSARQFNQEFGELQYINVNHTYG
eukprot:CAMPEP_0197077428 /NCGR_PEP_ID=MMETSP1384-20130603/212617_1 /TAXON_ID=29189 /ORGANISM="Ammonia sp." /LENGTH=373 /DNA_ID=CAMNT_0042516295 /DNA_START=9 /DNA_END=1133 /DNA_ORIENTATION=+